MMTHQCVSALDFICVFQREGEHVRGSDPAGKVCVHGVFKGQVMTHSLFVSHHLFTFELQFRRLGRDLLPTSANAPFMRNKLCSWSCWTESNKPVIGSSTIWNPDFLWTDYFPSNKVFKGLGLASGRPQTLTRHGSSLYIVYGAVVTIILQIAGFVNKPHVIAPTCHSMLIIIWKGDLYISWMGKTAIETSIR